MNRLNRGFSELPNTDLDNVAAAIVSALTGNTNFPTTNPPLASVTAAVSDYQGALTMSAGPARNTRVRSTRSTLTTLLQQLAANLELIPNVTDAQLATTGFTLRRAATRTEAALEVPQNVRLKHTGISGQLKVMFDPAPRAKGYVIEYSLDPNTDQWTHADIFSGARGVVLSGLARGKDYWVRVRALGPGHSKSGWGDPATMMVI
jgi:hypothetical protein